MRPAVVVVEGPRFALVDLEAPGAGARVPLGSSAAEAAAGYAALDDGAFPPAVVRAIRALPAGREVAAAARPWIAPLARAAQRPVRLAALGELRAARAAVDGPASPDERRFRLAVARAALARALASPEEVLIALAREEERVERALGRETRAAEAFVVVPSTVLADYAPIWSATRAGLAEHQARLLALLEGTVRGLVPNLAALVGDRVAARLVAAAGGIAPLGRIGASRLQLLGARRRPSAGRGPRYGLLYRAARMTVVPPGRRGAYARSLAALAVIASRADALTRADLTGPLLARRDRRVEALRRGRP